MEATAKTQRRRAPRKVAGSSVIRIQMKDGLGVGKRLTAAVVDMIDGGFGVNLRAPLKPGSKVVVGDQIEAEVRWCVAKPDGTFRAGLQRLGGLDCYEVMQLSPNADAETISRVYRLLAARYHPDNRETGDSEKFIRLSGAYQILSDPEKRARYDVGQRDAARPERRKRIDGSSRQGRRKGDKLPPSVGALRGWNSALRQPGF
jgi:hypothetical protein